MVEKWTEAELEAAVSAYLEMLRNQEQGSALSKTEVRRRLLDGPLKARSGPSIEYRMRNISSVMQSHGKAWVKGYVPAQNVGEGIGAQLWSIIQRRHALNALKGDNSPGSDAEAVQPPIIYFNVGWMKRYQGTDADDPTIGAHGYLAHYEHGDEAFNFVVTKAGTVQGYRPPGTRDRTNITKLGAQRSASSVGGVLVVWLAREPGSGRTLIVGWYRNATVFRDARRGSRTNQDRIFYSVEAEATDATLLPPGSRTFEVKSSRVSPGAGYGQKPTWYGAPSVDRNVWEYVLSRSASSSPGAAKKPPKAPRNDDPELRRKVEKAAVTHATAYYKQLYGKGCEVVSVETQAKGWDLEVRAGDVHLLVEVKGLLNANLVCELTPNEFSQMKLKDNFGRYIVYVVNNALAVSPAVPIASIFSQWDDGEWAAADGRRLVVTEKVAAVLSST